MIVATLAVIPRGENVLLGKKKKGKIGIGVLSGPGGVLEPGETFRTCLIRETREELEIELDPTSLELVGVIDFYHAEKIDFRVIIYRAQILSGELHETDDMIPDWYPLSDETFARTYEADRFWLPKAARGERFRAKVYYRERARGFERIEFMPFPK